MNKGKKRLDLILVERGLASTRKKAQALILAGHVLVDDAPVLKSGSLVKEESAIRLRGEQHPYVSRGGVKLAAAIRAFGVNVAGRTAIDVGASTGGFTEVLLLENARLVHALDVGRNQLDWKIRSDQRVIVHEGVNARYLKFETIGQKIDIIVVDVSFISLTKILPALMAISHAETDWITLVKPQFEVGKEKVGKGGIVSAEADHVEVLNRIRTFGETLGLKELNLLESPIKGTQGNKEFLVHWSGHWPGHWKQKP